VKGKLHLYALIFIILFSVTEASYAFDENRYARILRKYVHQNKVLNGIRMNVVDYTGLLNEKNNPASDYSKLLIGIASFNPSQLSSRNARIAFWINAYNIGAINLILDYYPVDSIRSLRINILTNPWNKEVITVNGRRYSLGTIEHRILLGTYGMKMIHFGIVCASVSCPDLSREVYTEKNLNALLKKQARNFLSNRKKGLRIDRKNRTVYVSRIFKYDSKSFGRGKVDIIPFILPLVRETDREYLREEGYSLEFLPYNWKLNDLKRAR
jgi:hypothetical protein